MGKPRRTPRRKSYDEPGHAHELTFTCYRRYPFLKSNRTCAWLAESSEAARTRLNFDLWAFVFMPDHVHLIVCPRNSEYRVPAILSAIKEPVGRQAVSHLEAEAPDWLPKLTRNRGQRTERLFWQSGGGFDRNITKPTTLWAMIEYVHQNPVRSGLVERASHWPWSSAGWYLEPAAPLNTLKPDVVPSDWSEESP